MISIVPKVVGDASTAELATRVIPIILIALQKNRRKPCPIVGKIMRTPRFFLRLSTIHSQYALSVMQEFTNEDL